MGVAGGLVQSVGWVDREPPDLTDLTTQINQPPKPNHPCTAKGVADPNTAGLFTALIRRAGALAPADNEEGPAPPTVLIETERQYV